MKISDLPFGSVVRYRRKLYWVSAGVEAPIVTGVDGHWWFIRELKWKSFEVIFRPDL